jgi:hypothetical protein
MTQGPPRSSRSSQNPHNRPARPPASRGGRRPSGRHPARLLANGTGRTATRGAGEVIELDYGAAPGSFMFGASASSRGAAPVPGGLTTKVHLLADSGCRPRARVTRHRHDSLAFIPLIGRLAIARSGRGRPRTRPGRVLGDKAYSSTFDLALTWGSARSKPRFPDLLTRAVQAPARQPGWPSAGFRRPCLKQRNIVERAFCRPRQNRVVATRYDKRDFVWRETVELAAASIRIWLRHPVS